MNPRSVLVVGLILGLGLGVVPGFAGVKVVFERNDGGNASAPFRFERVPPPSQSDAAGSAKFTLLDGRRDANGGELEVLNDGRVPTEADQPGRNFFFAAGSAGGRFTIDLGRRTPVTAVNSYSWHPGARGPQVYRLYADNPEAADFKADPSPGADLEKSGWQLVAAVDTLPKEGSGGGQYGVHIADADKPLGEFRYLLFDVARTDSEDNFGQTFFSEIDVVDPTTPAKPVTNDVAVAVTSRFTADGGRYHFTMDTTVATDLTEWAEKELQPVVQEWYPRLIALLPSEGFVPRTNVTIRFRDNMGRTPASAGGGFINCNAGWFRRELKREALGSVVHEMVHVVQNYGRVRREAQEQGITRIPGWLVEGIPDYIRWFLYEPQTRGAEITARGLASARYDASYRVTGNFLNWVTGKYDTNIVRKLNAAGRAGQYRETLWKDYTGRTVQELGDEWRKYHEDRLAAVKPANPPATNDLKKPVAP